MKYKKLNVIKLVLVGIGFNEFINECRYITRFIFSFFLRSKTILLITMNCNKKLVIDENWFKYYYSIKQKYFTICIMVYKIGVYV